MNATRSTVQKKATTKKKSKSAAKTSKKKSAEKKTRKVSKRRDDNLQPALRQCVSDALDHYFEDMGEHDPNGMYRMVMDEVEGPLLSVVMGHCEGNQTRASEILGINRATLRKKLRLHKIL